VLGHDPEGVAHQLGHGPLAGEVGAGLEPLGDRVGELDVAAVQGRLGPGQLGDLGRPGVLGEEQLEQAEAAELRGLLGRLGQPGGERGPALGGDPVAAPPPPGLLALLGQQAQEELAMAAYEDLRQRHLADLAALLPEHVQRLRWPAERLAQERRDRLRDLLRVAKASSPWHRERLAGVDPDRFEEADLAGLPPMTKDDLMVNWDQVVTDRRLGLDLVDGHLAGLESDRYLLEEFHAVASGGSSGRRGIFVFGWQAWATAYAGFLRPSVWDRAVTPELAAGPLRMAMVGARNATHMTSAMPQTFANPTVDVALFPVTQPIEEIVAGLNAYQPLVLMGYPSMLTLLAVEARAGRLRILPRHPPL
jgi:hypothetical protein